MKYEHLSDLLDAYENGELSRDNLLIIDEDLSVAYVEKDDIQDQDDKLNYDDSEENSNCLFYINLIDLTNEAIKLLNIPID